ncbi:hypothetical protein BDZ94DRAFT_160788 [Collybia nuda]|uniref:Uncharacterized protein n=1 Tax=Collybia nuda TaxID=64659 RepID=A0A9P5XW84_9AGAR|nr:hypothetical protein BDZ94DRAFT_471299 [Collybia nuda]KAF9457950.1 hypothetical protein BDZ94DRAFT_160788 [Collybia nuda]
MSDLRRLLEAAAALSHLLRVAGVPHTFYGSAFTAVLANSFHSDELFCIVESGHHHPFRRVRDALAGNPDYTTMHSPWTNRLHTTYRRLIPAIEIEILVAGETGPRHLDSITVMNVQGIPFLTVSEFVRAKLKTWMIRGLDADAQDISYTLSRYWNRVDINRIPEQDMNHFVSRHTAAAPAWSAIKRKYRM